jgi:hypothetical protein
MQKETARQSAYTSRIVCIQQPRPAAPPMLLVKLWEWRVVAPPHPLCRCCWYRVQLQSSRAPHTRDSGTANAVRALAGHLHPHSQMITCQHMLSMLTYMCVSRNNHKLTITDMLFVIASNHFHAEEHKTDTPLQITSTRTATCNVGSSPNCQKRTHSCFLLRSGPCKPLNSPDRGKPLTRNSTPHPKLPQCRLMQKLRVLRRLLRLMSVIRCTHLGQPLQSMQACAFLTPAAVAKESVKGL